MKSMKRTIAAVLASLMLASSVSFNTAIAAEEKMTDDEAIVVSKVGASGIMIGTDKGFEAEKTLTRAEAAAIMVRMKGISQSQVDSAVGETLFTDVAATDWAAGYINVASNLQIIKGVGDNKFDPTKEVTVAEFTTMAVRALGAGILVESMGTWPTNYMNFASEEKLTEGVVKVYTAAATRMDAAKIVANTLESNTWQKSQATNTNEVTYVKTGKTILSETLEITPAYSAVITDVDMKDRTVTFTGTAYELDGKTTFSIAGWGSYEVAEDVDLAMFKKGMEVDVWAKEKDKEIIRISKAETSKQTQISFTEVVKYDAANKKLTLVVDGSEKKYDLADELTVYFNEAKLANSVIGSYIVKSDSIFGSFIVENGEITTVYAERFTNLGVVKEVKNDTIYFESTTDIKGSNATSRIDLDDDDCTFAVIKDGKEIKASEIAAGDALYFYTKEGNNKDFVIRVNNAAIEGVVKSVSSDEKSVKIDDTTYEVRDSGIFDSGDVGKQVKAYLRGVQKISMFEEVEGTDSSLALVKELRAVKDKYNKPALEIKLMKLDGTELETMEIDLEESYKKLNDVTSATDANKADLAALIYNDTADVDDYDKTAAPTFAESIVGEMIAYSTKSGKVVIREYYSTGDTMATSYGTEPKMEVADGAYSRDTKKIDGYKLTDSTTIYTMKLDEKAYKAKFEKIELANLADSATSYKALVAGVNEDNNTVETCVFIESTVSRKTENNYAVVTKVSSIDDDDYDVEVELLLNDGTTTEVKYDGSLAKGTVIEATIADGILTDATTVATGANALTAATADLINAGTTNDYVIKGGYIMNFNGDTMKVLLSNGSKEVIDNLENVIFHSIDSEGKYKAGKDSDVDTVQSDLTYAQAEALYLQDKATYVELVCVEKTEVASDFDVVAVRYGKENTELHTVAIAPATVNATVADGKVTAGEIANATAGTVTYSVDGKVAAAGNTATVVYTAKNGAAFGAWTSTNFADTADSSVASGFHLECTSATVDENKLTVVYTVVAD